MIEILRNRVMQASAVLTVVCGVAIAPVVQAEPSGQAAVLEEMVVTAQRREQNYVDVPISLGIVDGDELRRSNFSVLTDLQFIEPTVNYNSNFGGGFQIRGVGTQSVTASVEQSVSIVIDDIVHGLPEISFAGPSYNSLNDIERIEILRGPQGTLFGKNSSAGVIQIVTKKPEVEAFTFDGTISFASEEEQKYSANVNIPLNDTSALRISGYNHRRDGYVKNLFNGEDVSAYKNYGVRAKYLATPTDRLEIYLIGSWNENSDSGNGIWSVRSCGSGFAGTQGVFSACDELANFGITPGKENTRGAWDGPLGVKTEAQKYSAKITYELNEDLSLVSITAYQEVDIFEDVEVDSTQRPILSVNTTDFLQDLFTQEIRLQGTTDLFGREDGLDFTLGGYYYQADVLYVGLQAGTFHFLPDDSPVLLTSGVGGPHPCCETVTDTETTSIALFGQATAYLSDAFAITAGLRWTKDENELKNNDIEARSWSNHQICQFAWAFGGTCEPAVGLPTPISRLDTDADDVSGKITLQYYFNESMNAYVTYATGYKGPSVQYPRGLPLLEIDPETAKSVELGFKGQFLDRRLQIGASIFRTDYDDFQGQSLWLNPENPASRGYVTTNAGGLLTEGFEVDLQLRATDALTLSVNYAHTETEYEDFWIPCNDGYTNPATVPGSCVPGPRGVNEFNADGYPLIYAPEDTFSLGLHYARPIGDSLEMQISANYRWQDESYTLAADPNSIMDERGILGLNVGIGPMDGRWQVDVFARNLLDEHFVVGIIKTPLDAGSANSTPLSTIGYSNWTSREAERTVGLKLTFSFN
ncbi:MAG: TonB-dependent receptor [Pseudomonadales bacterium]